MPDTAATPGTRTDLALLEDLVDEVEDVFHGKREVVRLALAGPTSEINLGSAPH